MPRITRLVALAFVLAALAGADTARAAIVIDDFTPSTQQSVTIGPSSAANPITVFATIDNSGILGGNRELQLTRRLGNGVVNGSVGFGFNVPGILQYGSNGANGNLLLTYDGNQSSDVAGNANNLGPIDATQGGLNDGIFFVAGSDLGTVITIRAISGATGANVTSAIALGTISSIDTPTQAVFIPFTAFTGVNFTMLSSLLINVNSTNTLANGAGGTINTDVSLDLFSFDSRGAVAPEPGTIGGALTAVALLAGGGWMRRRRRVVA